MNHANPEGSAPQRSKDRGKTPKAAPVVSVGLGKEGQLDHIWANSSVESAQDIMHENAAQ